MKVEKEKKERKFLLITSGLNNKFIYYKTTSIFVTSVEHKVSKEGASSSPNRVSPRRHVLSYTSLVMHITATEISRVITIVLLPLCATAITEKKQ